MLLKGLSDSQDELLAHLEGITEAQWYFRPDTNQWSIAYVVEHLELQETMHFREIYVLSNVPEPGKQHPEVRERDDRVSAYATNPVKDKASQFVVPHGRWPNRDAAVEQFNQTRETMISFVKGTNRNLRAYYTYRNLPSTDYRSIRDLHQIILTTIAHTRRHIGQIERIKDHPDYPGS